MNIVTRSDGYFRANCGFVLKGGERIAKAFTLTKDKKDSQRLADAIDHMYGLETAADPTSGKKVWSEDNLARYEAFRAQVIAEATIEALPPVPRPSFVAPQLVASSTFTSDLPFAQPFPRLNISFHAAVDQYVKAEKERAGASDRHYRDTHSRWESLKRHLADCPLHDIDSTWIYEASQIIKRRPPRAGSDRPISKVLPSSMESQSQSASMPTSRSSSDGNILTAENRQRPKGCGPTRPKTVHAGLAELLNKYDVNVYVVSVKVYAVKPND